MFNPLGISNNNVQYNNRHTKNALIGSSNLHLSIILQKQLKQFGFDSDLVSTGDDILKKIEASNTYDIIFTNNIFKNGKYSTGFDVLTQLKKQKNFSTPIVIYTVSSDRDYFIKLGFDEYLSKHNIISELPIILNKFF